MEIVLVETDVKPGHIDVKVFDLQSEIVANAEVRLYAGDVLVSSEFTGLRGLVEFKDLPPGVYHIQVSKAGFEDSKLTEVIVESEETAFPSFFLKPA